MLKRKFSGAPIKRKRARLSLSDSSDSGNHGGPISFGVLPQFGGIEEQSNDSSDGADKELAKAIMEEEIIKLFPNGLQERTIDYKNEDNGDRSSVLEEFAQVLVLKTKGLIEVVQKEAYSSFTVKRKESR